MRPAPEKTVDHEPPELSEADVARLLNDASFRKKVDKILAEAEALGGGTPSAQVFAELRARHGL